VVQDPAATLGTALLAGEIPGATRGWRHHRAALRRERS
jgi:hypothetical protein